MSVKLFSNQDIEEAVRAGGSRLVGVAVRLGVTPQKLVGRVGGGKVMGVDTWQIERDIGLARLNRNNWEVARLEVMLEAYQKTCSHVLAPDEGPARCYKCGAIMGGQDALVSGGDGVDREHYRSDVVAPSTNLVVADLQAAIAAKGE